MLHQHHAVGMFDRFGRHRLDPRDVGERQHLVDAANRRGNRPAASSRRTRRRRPAHRRRRRFARLFQARAAGRRRWDRGSAPPSRRREWCGRRRPTRCDSEPPIGLTTISCTSVTASTVIAEGMGADPHDHRQLFAARRRGSAGRREMQEFGEAADRQHRVAQLQDFRALHQFDLVFAAVEPDRLDDRMLRQGEALAAGLDDQRRARWRASAESSGRNGCPVRALTSGRGAADRLDVLAHHVHADAAS